MAIEFYDVPEMEYSLIPSGVILDVIVDIVPHNGGAITYSKTSNAEYINLALVVKEGEHENRKIYHKIGIKGNKVDEEGTNKWAEMGKLEIKRLLGSARHVSKQDKSEEAKKKLRLKNLNKINLYFTQPGLDLKQI